MISRLKKEMLIILVILGFTLCEEFNDVIYDDEGNEFYAKDKNDKWDLSTLGGIIEYSNFLAKERGKWSAKYEIRKAIGF